MRGTDEEQKKIVGTNLLNYSCLTWLRFVKVPSLANKPAPLVSPPVPGSLVDGKFNEIINVKHCRIFYLKTSLRFLPQR